MLEEHEIARLLNSQDLRDKVSKICDLRHPNLVMNMSLRIWHNCVLITMPYFKNYVALAY